MRRGRRLVDPVTRHRAGNPNAELDGRGGDGLRFVYRFLTEDVKASGTSTE